MQQCVRTCPHVEYVGFSAFLGIWGAGDGAVHEHAPVLHAGRPVRGHPGRQEGALLVILSAACLPGCAESWHSKQALYPDVLLSTAP